MVKSLSSLYSHQALKLSKASTDHDLIGGSSSSNRASLEDRNGAPPRNKLRFAGVFPSISAVAILAMGSNNY